MNKRIEYNIDSAAGVQNRQKEEDRKKTTYNSAKIGGSQLTSAHMIINVLSACSYSYFINGMYVEKTCRLKYNSNSTYSSN